MASLIYKNLFLYRLAMNLLYTGSYRNRFRPLIGLVTGKSVLELCFADTVIAEWCQKNSLKWTGFDINKKFVSCAEKKGFDAKLADLNSIETLPRADVCIMAGSLYHFMGKENRLFRIMLNASPRIIISEPVRNLSAMKGPVGKIARNASATGTGRADQRYDKESLLALLSDLSLQLGFNYMVTGSLKKDLIITLSKE